MLKLKPRLKIPYTRTSRHSNTKYFENDDEQINNLMLTNKNDRFKQKFESKLQDLNVHLLNYILTNISPHSYFKG